jgi:glycosyltransferase involved in cell wall biosynthesis
MNKKKNKNILNYLMVLNVTFYRTSPSTIAIESSFANHLFLIKEKLSKRFSRKINLIVSGPLMSKKEYEFKKNTLREIDEDKENILFEGLPTSNSSPIKLCVLDIDFRKSALMNYKTKRWSLKSYLLCKYIYDPIRSVQLRIASNLCSLTLLKGKKLCKDYGRLKKKVRYILDASHSEKDIINQEKFSKKITYFKNKDVPLELVYFGRLTAYKGIDCMIKAIGLAKRSTNTKIKFHIIGEGEEKERLMNLTKRLNLGENIFFHGGIKFGKDLFNKLYIYHLLLAAPLSEDTPRSALDAMAAGIPILAFNTYYYKELESSGAVETVPWLSVNKMADKIVYFSTNKERLIGMSKNAVDFAKQNTQEIWLDRRLDWTYEMFNK